jgi:hypothetical protein
VQETLGTTAAEMRALKMDEMAHLMTQHMIIVEMKQLAIKHTWMVS